MMIENKNNGRPDFSPPTSTDAGEDEFNWFKERREMLAKGIIPEVSAKQAMQQSQSSKPVADDRLPVGRRSESAVKQKNKQKRKGDIKQFRQRETETRDRTDRQTDERTRQRASSTAQNQQGRPSARDTGAQRRQQPKSDAARKKAEDEKYAHLSRDERRVLEAKKKKLKKRNRTIIGVAVSLAVALALFTALSLTVLFGVETITVEGKTRYSSDEVIAACSVEIGDNLWMVDKAKVNSDVCEALSFVGEVTVKRSPPSTLVLTVLETKAKYAIPFGENYITVNKDGKVLSRIEREIPKDVCELVGFEFSVANVGNLIEPAEKNEDSIVTANNLLSVSSEKGINPITSINVANSSALYLIYDGRIKLYLGTDAKAEKKLNLGSGVLTKLNAESNDYTGVLNLSVIGKAYFNSGSVDAEATAAKAYEVNTEQ